jgi:hypothetical protein
MMHKIPECLIFWDTCANSIVVYFSFQIHLFIVDNDFDWLLCFFFLSAKYQILASCRLGKSYNPRPWPLYINLILQQCSSHFFTSRYFAVDFLHFFFYINYHAINKHSFISSFPNFVTFMAWMKNSCGNLNDIAVMLRGETFGND